MLRILSIGAHPADIFDQSGGTMAHHVARGDWVGCVVLTHGARIHDKVISDSMYHRDEVPDASKLNALMTERADVKTAEVRAACAILGVENIAFFGADDAVLLVTEPTVRRLARVLRELRPDVILTHFPREGDGGSGSGSRSTPSVWPPASTPATATRRTKSPRSSSLAQGRLECGATCGRQRGAITTMYSLTSPTWWKRNWPPWTAW
jgi:hypothetical protein